MHLRYGALFGAAVFCFSLVSHSQPTHIIEVLADDRLERSQVSELGYAIEEVFSDKVYVYGTAEDARKLQKAGFEAKADLIQERWFDTESTLQSRFTSYEDVLKRLNALVEKRPDLASIQIMGQSAEGRDLEMIRISQRSPEADEINGTPQMVYMGCHHAREHMSVEVPLLFAEYLINNYESNETVKRLVDSREIYILPVLNPDGHIYDYTNGIRGRWWRKNREVNRDGTIGVDLNRNYSYFWGSGGSSSNPRSDTYMGPAPFSAPETAAVRDFLSSRTRLRAMLDFHSFSELVLYPWGYTYDEVGVEDGTVEDREIFETMAQQMARWNGYTPQQGSDLYIASGNLFDYAYGELGIYSFTFELSPRSQWEGAFYPSPSTIPQNFEDNLKPMLYILEYADDPKRVLTEDAPDFDLSPAEQGVAIASHADLKF